MEEYGINIIMLVDPYAIFTGKLRNMQKRLVI